MVHFHGVDSHPKLVFLQPGEKGTSVLEVIEAGTGFQDSKEDKLLLGGQGWRSKAYLKIFSSFGISLAIMMGDKEGLADFKQELGSNILAVSNSLPSKGMGLTLLSVVNGIARQSMSLIFTITEPLNLKPLPLWRLLPPGPVP